MLRCLNNIFGYCTGKPESEEGKEVKSGDLTVIEKKCKLSPETCGKHQLFSQQVDGSELQDPHMVETITPVKSAKATKSVKKEKVVKEEKAGARLI